MMIKSFYIVLIVVISASAGMERVKIDPISPRADYLYVSRIGEVNILSPDRNFSMFGSQNDYQSNLLNEGEYFVFDAISYNGYIYGYISNSIGIKELRSWKILSNAFESVSTVQLSLNYFGLSSYGIIRQISNHVELLGLDGEWKHLSDINGNIVGSSQNWLYTNIGEVYEISQNGTAFQLSSIGVNTEILSGPYTDGTNVVFKLKNNTLLWWTGELWKNLNSNISWVPTSGYIKSQNSDVQIVFTGSDGIWESISLSNDRITGHGATYTLPWYDVVNGGGEIYSNLTAFAKLGSESMILGWMHHRAVLGDDAILVNPMRFSPTIHKNVQFDVAVTGALSANICPTIFDEVNDGSREIITNFGGCKDVSYGAQLFYWDGKNSSGNFLSDGEYIISTVIQSNGLDATTLEKRFIIDNTPPKGNINGSFVLNNQNDTLKDNQSFFRVSQVQKLCLDYSNIKDEMNPNETIGSKLLLKTNAGQFYTYRTLQDKICLDGNDPIGVSLPNGTYELFSVVSDQIGNADTLKGVIVGDKNIEIISINKPNRSLNATFLPAILVEGQSNAVLRIDVGAENDTPFKVITIIHNQQIIDTAISTNSDGTATLSIQRNWRNYAVSGVNTVLVKLIDNEMNVYSIELPLVVDHFQTTILSPKNGDILTKSTEIRGVASAPFLENNGGFSSYRAYLVKGSSVKVEGTANNISMFYETVGGSNWFAIEVPLQKQIVNFPSLSTRQSFDSFFPHSNIGGVDATNESVLATLDPSNFTDGEYSICIVAEQNYSNSLVSYDCKSIRIATSGKENPTYKMHVNENGLDSLDRRNAKDSDNNITYNISIDEGQGFLQVLIVDSLGQQYDHKKIWITKDKSIAWLFEGMDAFGSYLPDGKYTIYFDLFDANLGLQFKESKNVKVKNPYVLTTNPLTIEPDPIYIDSKGLSEATIRVELPQKQLYQYVITNYDSSVTYISKLLNGNSYESVWRFTDSLNQNINISDNDKFIVSIHSVSGLWMYKDTINLQGSLPIVLVNSIQPDSIWHAPIWSGFKFKGKLKSHIKYFPPRMVSLKAKFHGKQVARKFRDIEFPLTLSKFYNSAEVISNYHYSFYYKNDYSGHQYPTSDGYGRSSMYALGNPRDFTTVLDSSQYKGNRQNEFGDLPYYDADNADWVANDSSYVSHICPPPKLNSDSRYEYEKDDECRAFAKSNNVKMKSGSIFYDDKWKFNKGDNNISAFFAKIPIQETVFSEAIGAKFLSLNSLSLRNDPIRLLNNTFLIEDILTPENESCKESPLKVEMPYICDPGHHIYFTKRGSWKTRERYNYLIGEDDYFGDEGWVWDNDASSQANFTYLPHFNWNHAYLLQRGDQKFKVNAFKSIGNFTDWMKWEENTGSCYSDKITNCEAGGRKIGQRGFSYTIDSAYFSLSSGDSVYPWQVFQNFFDRSRNTGFVYWLTEQSESGNDDVGFNFGKMNTDNNMLGITWVQDTVEFPIQGTVDSYLDKSSVLCYNDECKFNELSFPKTIPNSIDDKLNGWYLLRNNKSSETVNPHVDSVYIDLTSQMKDLLGVTDSKLKVSSVAVDDPSLYQYYKYLLSDSLKASTGIQEFVYINGNLQSVQTDVDESKYSFIDIRQPKSLKDSLGFWVRYLNNPVVDQNWSSAEDPLFERTGGYLYGTGLYNESAFRSVDNGLDDGILSYVSLLGLDSLLAEQSLESTSPFVKQGNALKFNTNLIADQSKWDIEVYQFNGEEVHKQLNLLQSNMDNFSLGLKLSGTAKNYVRIQMNLPLKISDFEFSHYRIFWRDSVRHYIPVNQAYRHPNQEDITLGKIYPTYKDDFWNNPFINPLDTIPSLAYWDVTHLNGDYPIEIEGFYQRADLPGEYHLARWTQIVRVGTELSDAVTTIHSAYRRASLEMPLGISPEGSMVSIYPVDILDVKLPEGMPEFIPVGPIIEIHSTDKTPFFEGDIKPTLKYRYTAKEIYELEGDANLHQDSPEQIKAKLLQYSAQYKMYVLGETKKLDPLVTMYVIEEDQNNPEDMVLILSSQLPHFSYAMVLKDKVHSGYMPRLELVYLGQGKDTIIVRGKYSYGFDEPPLLWSATTMPTDLALTISAEKNYSKVQESIKKQYFPSLDVHNGSFELRIPKTELGTGEWYFYLHYIDAMQADKKYLEIADTGFVVSEWTEFTKSSLIPQCGVAKHQILAFASQKGVVRIFTKDANGSVIGFQNQELLAGWNRLTWDGCFDGQVLSKGQYYREYQALNGQGNFTSLVWLDSEKRPYLNSIQIQYSDFVPVQGVHALEQRIEVNGYELDQLNLQIEVIGPNGYTTVLPYTTINNQKVVASWSGDMAPLGFYHAIVKLVNSLATPLQAEFRVIEKSSGFSPTITVQPDSVGYLDPSVRFLVKTKIPTRYALTIENTNGETIGTIVGTPENLSTWYEASTGTTEHRWQWVNELDVPDHLRLRWFIDGQSGGDTLIPLAIRNTSMVLSDITFTPKDTLYPEDLSKAGSVAVYRFYSNRSGKALISVYSIFQNEEMARFTNDVKVGWNTVSWTGYGFGDTLVASGPYRIQLFKIPERQGIEPVLESTEQVFVKRTPLVSICLLTHKNIDLANSIQGSLAEHGLFAVDLLDQASCLDYSIRNSKGITVFLESLLGSEFEPIGGNDFNSRFIAQGGNVVFALSTLPTLSAISLKQEATGVLSDHSNSTLQWWSELADKSIFYPTLPIAQISKNGNRVVSILSSGTDINSFFVDLPGKNGSVLALYPFDISVVASNEKALANDIANQIWMQYFEQDIRIIDIAFDSTISPYALPNGKATFHALVEFVGKGVIKDATLQLLDAKNANTQITIPIGDLQAGVSKSLTVEMPIVESATAGEHTVSFTLFSSFDDKNLENNHLDAIFTLADLDPPTITIDTLKQVRGKFNLIRLVSQVMDQSPGIVKMITEIYSDSDQLLLVKMDSVTTGTSQKISRTIQIPYSNLPNQNYKVIIQGIDSYGNKTELRRVVLIDRSAPTNLVWRIESPVIFADSSALSDASIQTMSEKAIHYSLGKGTQYHNWKALDNIGIDSIALFNEEGVAVWQQRLNTVLTGDFQNHVSNEFMKLEVFDAAGNSTTAYLQLDLDTISPELSVYEVKRTLLDSIVDGNYMPSTSALMSKPLYHFSNLPEGEMDFFNAAPPTLGTAVMLGSEMSDWHYESIVKESAVRMVLHSRDKSIVQYRIWVDGVSKTEMELNPYLAYPIHSKLEPYKDILLEHPSDRIIEIPAGVTDVRIEATDVSGNTTVATLLYKKKTSIAFVDPQGDVTSIGATDYASVHFSSENTSGHNWLNVFVRSYNRMVIGETQRLYIDSDNNQQTGTTAGGYSGFEHYLAWRVQDTIDDTSGICAEIYQWSSNFGWNQVLASGCGKSSSNLFVAMNADNSLWTEAIGAGQQLLADNTSVPAYHAAEFKALWEQNFPAEIRWYLEGIGDKVEDVQQGRANAFTPVLGDIKTIDGSLSDWWEGDLPQNTFGGQLHVFARSSRVNEQAVTAFDFWNDSYSTNKAMEIVHLVRIPNCMVPPQVSAGTILENFRVPTQLVKANTLEEYTYYSDDVYALVIQIREGIFSAGSHYRGALQVMMWNGCSTEAMEIMDTESHELVHEYRIWSLTK